jgi:hypothetical protein
MDSAMSKNDNWEAWKEIQMQTDQMRQLEEQLKALCFSFNIDHNQMIYEIDFSLLNAS